MKTCAVEAEMPIQSMCRILGGTTTANCRWFRLVRRQSRAFAKRQAMEWDPPKDRGGCALCPALSANLFSETFLQRFPELLKIINIWVLSSYSSKYSFASLIATGRVIWAEDVSSPCILRGHFSSILSIEQRRRNVAPELIDWSLQHSSLRDRRDQWRSFSFCFPFDSATRVSLFVCETSLGRYNGEARLSFWNQLDVHE